MPDSPAACEARRGVAWGGRGAGGQRVGVAAQAPRGRPAGCHCLKHFWSARGTPGCPEATCTACQIDVARVTHWRLAGLGRDGMGYWAPRTMERWPVESWPGMTIAT